MESPFFGIFLWLIKSLTTCCHDFDFPIYWVNANLSDVSGFAFPSVIGSIFSGVTSTMRSGSLTGCWRNNTLLTKLSYFSQETFRAFPVAFRDSIDGYLILIIDGALYHKGEAVRDFVEDPRNEIEMYRLPAYSPELNPQEHVWKVLRKQYIHNRRFTSANETLTAARSGLRALQHSSELQGVYLECQHYFG